MNALDSGFLAALLVAPSFYRSVLAWCGAALLLGLLLLWLERRLLPRRSPRPKWRDLANDQSGAATAVDFVLTIPFFLTVVLLIVQFVSMAHDALIVHYAAYSAARSARVWIWEPPASGPLGGIVQLPPNPFSSALGAQQAQQQAERAARFALIAASPADPGLGSGPAPRDVLQVLARVAGHGGRAGALNNKAAYAFDARNSSVSIDAGSGGLASGSGSGKPRPVSARVEFRVHLGIPVAKVLGTSAGGGRYYHPVSAQMTVL